MITSENRDHQKADWKAHKTFCQYKKNASETLARIEAPGFSGLSLVQEIQQRLQDCSGVHLYSIHEAIVSAVQLAGPQFDIETEYICIRVGERMNNDGNPARAFFIKVMLSTDPESMKITPKDADRHHVYPDGFLRAEIQLMRPFLKDTMAGRAGSTMQGEEFMGYINVISKWLLWQNPTGLALRLSCSFHSRGNFTVPYRTTDSGLPIEWTRCGMASHTEASSRHGTGVS